MTEDCNNPEDAPLLDRAQALTNVEGDTDFLQEILDIFLEEIPERIDTFNNSIEQRDYKRISSAAHSLKGVSLTIGAISCHLYSKQLEKAARMEDDERIREVFNHLEDVLDRIKEELSR